jgi:3-methyladenine DNA glycosylase AlkD
MKYSLINPVLDAQITEIRRKIRLSMNGIVSEQMTRSGIVYKKNYGVSIPRIREIATSYHPDQDLARRLWFLQIRETMIMATLLQPVEKFNLEMAQSWVQQLNHTEIVEQLTMNLLCKLDFAPELSLACLESEKLWSQVTGFILAARIANKLNRAEIHSIVARAIEVSATTDFHLYKAVGLCLSRLCRNGKEVASYVLKEIEAFSTTTSKGQQYIAAEVKDELLFLAII